MPNISVGGQSVYTVTAGIKFSDGTSQNTAAVPTPPTPSPVLVATINLTSAQLLALSTTPVLLLPAPGAGLYYFVQSYILEYTFGGVAYSSGAHTQDCFINWGGQAINSANFIMQMNWAAAGGFIENTSSVFASGPCGNVPYSVAVANNNSLYFGVPNALSLGNGSLKVTVTYSVLPV
jgi:hypothetical protein